MTRHRHFLMLLALAVVLAGCAGATVVSPNDPDYGRNGAPRVGEYYTVRGPYQPLGSGGPSGGTGGM
jgi:hypothetical protein